MGGGTEAQRCEMHSPRQPKDKYQGREQQRSCPSAPACAPVCCSSTSSLPGAVQGVARSCFAMPLPVAQNPSQRARRHIAASSVGAAHTLVPRQVNASAALSKLFSFHCFFFTSELTVIATSRVVGYRLQAETEWLHAFSEQNKTGNLK